jgi:hypothetical protein
LLLPTFTEHRRVLARAQAGPLRDSAGTGSGRDFSEYIGAAVAALFLYLFMEGEVQKRKGANYGLYLIVGVIIWLIALASFDSIISLRGLRIGEILFICWWIFIGIGWVIFVIGCVKRFKWKYYK